jgi:acyl carrier protein
VIELEDEYDIDIPDEDAEAWKTVADVIAYVDGKVVGK